MVEAQRNPGGGKDLRLSTAELKAEISIVKGQIALLEWAAGFSLALSSAILVTLFLS